MNADKQKLLFDKYPRLYQGRYQGMKQNLMCFGFECGNGWFDIIDELSAKLEPLGVVAMQVKEKFGTLRFYTTGHDEEADEHIRAAEAKSEATCERCGAPGALREGGWLKTLCDGCDELRHSAAVDRRAASR